MKILTKVISVVLIVCFAFCLCIVSVSAAPAFSDGGFANEDYIIRPLSINLRSGSSAYRIPLALGTGLTNVGTTTIYQEDFTITSNATSLYISGQADFASVAFDSLLLPITDFASIVGNASVTRLDSVHFTGVLYDIDYSSSIEFSLDLYENSSSYFKLGDALFRYGSIYTNSQISLGASSLTDVQSFISSALGYEYIYIDLFRLNTDASLMSSGITVGFNSPYRDTYYSSFEIPVIERIEYEEQPDLVAWIYDVLQGIFSLQIFGDVTLGTLLLVAISVPLLVSMLKAIAGG